MRVFVTGVGRCGSVTFRDVCRYITNFTCGHETPSGRLEYPDNHIEVNPHLRCCLLDIRRKYPEARFVHLVRPPEDAVPSLAALNGGDTMRAWARLHQAIVPSMQPIDIAHRFYWVENDLIKLQLQAGIAENYRMEFGLESARSDWHTFWEWIGAEGDFEKSLNEWNWKYRRNSSESRGDTKQGGFPPGCFDRSKLG